MFVLFDFPRILNSLCRHSFCISSNSWSSFSAPSPFLVKRNYVKISFKPREAPLGLSVMNSPREPSLNPPPPIATPKRPLPALILLILFLLGKYKILPRSSFLMLMLLHRLFSLLSSTLFYFFCFCYFLSLVY